MGKAKVLIYGISHQAQQLKVLLDHDGQAEVCAFLVDKDYRKEDVLLGIPVHDFESIELDFSPEYYQIVLSFGYKNMVKNRQQKYLECKKKGYTLYTYLSKDAYIYSKSIGEGTIVYPNCFIAPHVHIGKGCFLENSVSIAHDSKLDDFIFCAAKANICGDNIIESNCFLGAGCIVAGAVTLKKRTLVAAGAVCLKNTSEGTVCFPPKTVYMCDMIPEDLI